MVAYNFKAQFADRVEDGSKRMTIRRRRRRPTRPGDALQHYTGMRTRKVRKLLDAVCTAVKPFDIEEDIRHQFGRTSMGGEGRGERVMTEAVRLTVRVNGEPLSPVQIKALAIADGFTSANTFIDFFAKTYGLPFSGEIVEW